MFHFLPHFSHFSHFSHFLFKIQEVKGVIPSVLKGIHATIFAYGITGSGKTHTMQGNEEHPGIIPRAAENLLNFAKVYFIFIILFFIYFYFYFLFFIFILFYFSFFSFFKILPLTSSLKEKQKENPNLSIDIRVSYLEIYNEKVPSLSPSLPLSLSPSLSNHHVFYRCLTCLSLPNKERVISLFENRLIGPFLFRG